MVHLVSQNLLALFNALEATGHAIPTFYTKNITLTSFQTTTISFTVTDIANTQRKPLNRPVMYIWFGKVDAEPRLRLLRTTATYNLQYINDEYTRSFPQSIELIHFLALPVQRVELYIQADDLSPLGPTATCTVDIRFMITLMENDVHVRILDYLNAYVEDIIGSSNNSSSRMHHHQQASDQVTKRINRQVSYDQRHHHQSSSWLADR